MEVASQNTGSLFIVAFPERIPVDDTLYFIQDNTIGGIILFADHCRDQDSLKSWLADLKKSLSRPLIVAVDQEGGRVRRFTHRFPMLDAPRHYGRLGNLEKYRDDLARVCERLFNIGINLNLVPVVDLLDAKEGHVLDSRTFSDKPDVVSRFARLTIDVHKSYGLLTCGKHFPGLGRSDGDPHHVLALSDLTENDFAETELPPFADMIDAGVDAVMVTHLSAPKVDGKPAIVSEKMIQGWLKEKLAFGGPVITDDLLMGGAAYVDAVPELAIKSFAAGADLLLFGQNLTQTRQAFDAFGEAWQAGRFGPKRMDDASGRAKGFTDKIFN